MGLFSSIKKKTAKVEEPVVTEEMKKAEETQKAVEDLDAARPTIEQINDAFDDVMRGLDMKTGGELAVAMRKSLAANDQKLQKLADAKAQDEADGAATVDEMHSLYKLEDGLYISSADLNTYVSAVITLRNVFQEKTAVQAVITGADQINVYVVEYIKKLSEALRSGKMLKANACIDMLRFVLEAGYREEDTSDPEELQRRIDQKVAVIRDFGMDAISVIDEYYSSIGRYEIVYAGYSKNANEFFEKDKEVEALPDSIKEKLEGLSMKDGMKGLPPGDKARQYMTLIIQQQVSLARLLMKSMELESLMMHLHTLRTQFNDLLEYIKKIEAKNGNYDYREIQRRITEITKSTVDELARMQAETVSQQENAQTTISLVNEVAQNAQMGEAVANSMRSVRSFSKLYRKNEEMEREVAEKRAAMKEQEKLQEEEAQTHDPMEEEPEAILAE